MKKDARPRDAFFNAARPLVFGHRGSAGDMPENTFPSFDKALKDGADVLETDIHITKDGHLVLSHDEALERCTNGAGNIKDHTLAEIKQLDAAYNFSPDGGKTFPYRGKGVTIPTLQEAFRRYPGVRFNIDMKMRDDALVKSFADLVKAEGRATTVIAGSFNHVTMTKFRAYAQEIGINVLTCSSMAEITATVLSQKAPVNPLMAFESPTKKAKRDILPPALIDTLHAAGHVVVPWTIDDPAEIDKLLKAGVDGIISNYPARVADAIKKLKPPTV